MNITLSDYENLKFSTQNYSTIPSLNDCPNGYWKNGSNCQICGLCNGDGLCNKTNGYCLNVMCAYETLLTPHCLTCVDTFKNFPFCNISLEVNEKISLEFSSSNVICAWLIALSLIVLIRFLINGIYSVNESRVFLYDLEFEQVLSTKLNFKSTGRPRI